MDLRDDPSTTTTTDYDSGDNERTEYVYEGQKAVDRRSTKGRSPRRRRSPKAKPRGLGRCTCGGTREEEDAEITVFEDTDTEEEGHRCRSRRSRPSELSGVSASEERGHHRGDRRRLAEKKLTRERTPYIEEYPDDTPRPAIILKEHTILRRFSASDTKRVRDSKDRSPSSGSRGRSPSGKRPPPRPPRRSSKGANKASKQRRHHRLDYPEVIEATSSEPDTESSQSDSGESDLPPRHRPRREHDLEPLTAVSRSSARTEQPQPRYSSSWPLHGESQLPERQPRRREREHDSDEDEEEHLFDKDGRHNNEHHRLRQTRAPSFRHRERPCVPSVSRERRHREAPAPQREPERVRERSRVSHRHPRTVVSRSSMETHNHGGRSVATSLCEVWQGRPEDWESPYPSASEADWDSDIEEPVRLLRMDDLPPRRSSPHLLPPRGDRSDFGFQALSQFHPPYPPYPSPALVPGPHRRQTWANPSRTRLFLLEGPPALTTEPDVMTDEDDMLHYNDDMRPLSRASGWSRPVGPREAPRGWTCPLPPRSRAVSPVFSARQTREFLSPRPMRAMVRFDFGAWGVDLVERSSLALGML